MKIEEKRVEKFSEAVAFLSGYHYATLFKGTTLYDGHSHLDTYFVQNIVDAKGEVLHKAESKLVKTNYLDFDTWHNFGLDYSGKMDQQIGPIVIHRILSAKQLSRVSLTCFKNYYLVVMKESKPPVGMTNPFADVEGYR